MSCLHCADLLYEPLTTRKHCGLHANHDRKAIAVSQDLFDKLHRIAGLLPLYRVDSRVNEGIERLPGVFFEVGKRLIRRVGSLG